MVAMMMRMTSTMMIVRITAGADYYTRSSVPQLWNEPRSAARGALQRRVGEFERELAALRGAPKGWMLDA